MVLSDATMAELTGLLGRQARDTQTGSTGVISSVAVDASGGRSIALREKVRSGDVAVAGHWFPMATVELVEEGDDGE